MISTNPKIAIVVDDLLQLGGQELLFEAVIESFPNADVYTSSASTYWKEKLSSRNVNLYTSFLQKIPFIQKINRYIFPLLFHYIAFDRFDFSKYDLVISVSSRFAHTIHTKPSTVHVSYINSPPRMFWEPDKYFENESYGFLKPIKILARPFLSIFLSYARGLDFVASTRSNLIISNSINVQNKVRKFYKRDSLVLYPFHTTKAEIHKSHKNYFVMITRLISWKRCDVAVKACSDLGINLKIIGVGPAKNDLVSIAGSSIEFLGYAAAEKEQIISNSIGLIQTQEEDFGIVPLEFMANGKPVVAYGKGGVLETVLPGVTGEFYYEQSAAALAEVLARFDPKKYSTEACIKQANLFTKAIFQNKLEKIITLQLRQKI